MREEKMKEYLRTIYMLQTEGVVRGAYIAREMNLSKPTVSISLRQLAGHGYIMFETNRSVRLTDSGQELAKKAIYETISRGKNYHELLGSFECFGSDVSNSTLSDQRLDWLKKQKAECLLEALLILSNRFFCVRPIDIAHYLNKTGQSITKKLIKLEEYGFLTTGEHFSLSLTNSGLYYAEHFYCQHEKTRKSLQDFGMPNRIAEMEACRTPIEHNE